MQNRKESWNDRRENTTWNSGERRMKTTALLVLLTAGVMAQQQPVYEIPYGSKGNEVALAVANTSSLTAEEIKVELVNPPSWMKLQAKTQSIAKLAAKTEQTAAFTFDVEKTTEVNKEQTLSFSILGKNNQRWTKEIKIKVLAPQTYELFQNYPNPFNPTTKIEYQIPAGTYGHTSLRIYDMLGRDVATLVNEQKEPGGYEVIFDASRFASGVYIYQLQAGSFSAVKKMLLLR
jgi:hypothetical protein